jgi:hypothetical protein
MSRCGLNSCGLIKEEVRIMFKFFYFISIFGTVAS